MPSYIEKDSTCTVASATCMTWAPYDSVWSKWPLNRSSSFDKYLRARTCVGEGPSCYAGYGPMMVLEPNANLPPFVHCSATEGPVLRRAMAFYGPGRSCIAQRGGGRGGGGFAQGQLCLPKGANAEELAEK